VTKAFWYL